MDEIVRVLAERPQFDFEIILVNDGSMDNTFGIISELCNDPRIKGLDLTRNFGQSAATLAGIAHSTGNLIAYSDDDGETPIQDLWRMVDCLDETCDIVFAELDNRSVSWTRRFGSKAADFMLNALLGKPKRVRIGKFWVGRSSVVRTVLLSKNPSPYLAGLLLKSTNRMKVFQTVSRASRKDSSGYSFGKKLALWMNGVTGFSVAPLKITSLIGLIFGVAGLLLAINAAVQWFLVPGIPPGYTSVFASVIFFGGLNLLGIGLVGEYVGRMYLSLSGVPQFVIGRKINFTHESDISPQE